MTHPQPPAADEPASGLPPLPRCVEMWTTVDSTMRQWPALGYTADLMHEYALAALRAQAADPSLFDIKTADLLLMAGEMTAQELRTVRAVLGGLKRRAQAADPMHEKLADALAEIVRLRLRLGDDPHALIGAQAADRPTEPVGQVIEVVIDGEHQKDVSWRQDPGPHGTLLYAAPPQGPSRVEPAAQPASPHRTFEYLLNEMEYAAQQETPADHGYSDKRRAVFDYVRKLRAAQPPSEPARDGERLLREALTEALREVWAHSDAYNEKHGMTRTPEMQRMYLRAQKLLASAQEAREPPK